VVVRGAFMLDNADLLAASILVPTTAATLSAFVYPYVKVRKASKFGKIFCGCAKAKSEHLRSLVLNKKILLRNLYAVY
jgi:hypothetical protein